jgi:hypothetical protein
MGLTVRRLVRRSGGEDLLQLRDGVVTVAVEQCLSRGGKIDGARAGGKSEKRDAAESEDGAAKAEDARERCKWF